MYKTNTHSNSKIQKKKNDFAHKLQEQNGQYTNSTYKGKDHSFRAHV